MNAWKQICKICTEKHSNVQGFILIVCNNQSCTINITIMQYVLKCNVLTAKTAKLIYKYAMYYTLFDSFFLKIMYNVYTLMSSWIFNLLKYQISFLHTVYGLWGTIVLKQIYSCKNPYEQIYVILNRYLQWFLSFLEFLQCLFCICSSPFTLLFNIMMQMYHLSISPIWLLL